MTDSRSIHVSTNDPISFFLWLSNIPLHVYIHTNIYIYIQIYILYTHTPYLLYLFSCWGTFRCSHALAIVNCAATNTGAHCTCLFELWFSQGLRPGVGRSVSPPRTVQPNVWQQHTSSKSANRCQALTSSTLLWAGSALAHVSSMDLQYPDKSLCLIVPVFQEEH